MTDAILGRLTAISVEIEQHGTALWLLERERDELRTQLRRSLSVPGPLANARPAPGSGRGEAGFFGNGEST